MKKLIPGGVVLAMAGLIAGCETDSPKDLTYPISVENVTYTNTVRNIINNNCIICHGTIPANNAPMSLTTYENVRSAVLTRGLLDRISRPQGAPGMMPNGGTRLPQSQIDLIVQWNEQGLPE
jgi:hypothetical protein